MGAWAEDTFGNDTACDWIGDFLDEPGLSVVQAAVEAVLDADGYVDADRACNCLAACEVIARLQGRWGLRNAYSEALDQWVEAHPASIPETLKVAAEAAIDRILGPDSELPELWNEDSVNEDWQRAVEDLRRRVLG